MTVHFYDNETKELIHIKAAIYIPGVEGLAPHKVLQILNDDDEFAEYDADKYILFYIGR